MKTITLLLVALFSVSAVAQERVFRASSIDLEQNERLDSLEARVSFLEHEHTHTATPITSPAPRVVVPAPAPAPVVVDNYQARWKNYDGLSFRQHAEIMHGIDTTGLTDAQVARMRDHDHDTYGGGHPPAMRSRSTTTQAVQYSNSGCPGGVCPSNASSVSRTTTVQSRGGLFGFGILGRKR